MALIRLSFCGLDMGASTSNLVMPTGTLTADDSVQTGFDWKYTNDMLQRLTQAQAGTLSGGSITSETRKQIFDLDQVGNWTHSDLVTGGSTTEFDWDFTHNKVNEITGWDNQTNNVTPTYDASGNMTDDKRNWKYEYDAWYRLVRVKDQSNNVKAEFVYNALGFRISARYDETAPWMHFAYDERWRIVAMYEDDADASEPTEQFWYHNSGLSGLGGSSYIDAVILRDRDTDANGTLDERRYYLQNQHHDVIALINTSGSIVERVNYDPYGSPIGTFTSIVNRKGYAGYEYDAELGDTYHVRHRIYRSDLGVWTRRDPLGYVDGMGLYEYVAAQPVRKSDEIGLAAEDCDQIVQQFMDNGTRGTEPWPEECCCVALWKKVKLKKGHRGQTIVSGMPTPSFRGACGCDHVGYEQIGSSVGEVAEAGQGAGAQRAFGAAVLQAARPCRFVALFVAAEGA